MNSSDFISVKDHFYAFVSALLGFGFGVLWAEWKWRRERKAQARLLRVNLVKAFKFNLERIQQCLDYLQKAPPEIPNFRLDTATVGHILFTGRDLFDEVAKFDHANWQRYQLEHINAKLDYFHLYNTAPQSAQIGMLKEAYSSLVEHLKVTQKETSELILNLEKSV